MVPVQSAPAQAPAAAPAVAPAIEPSPLETTYGPAVAPAVKNFQTKVTDALTYENGKLKNPNFVLNSGNDAVPYIEKALAQPSLSSENEFELLKTLMSIGTSDAAKVISAKLDGRSGESYLAEMSNPLAARILKERNSAANIHQLTTDAAIEMLNSGKFSASNEEKILYSLANRSSELDKIRPVLESFRDSLEEKDPRYVTATAAVLLAGGNVTSDALKILSDPEGDKIDRARLVSALGTVADPAALPFLRTEAMAIAESQKKPGSSDFAKKFYEAAVLDSLGAIGGTAERNILGHLLNQRDASDELKAGASRGLLHYAQREGAIHLTEGERTALVSIARNDSFGAAVSVLGIDAANNPGGFLSPEIQTKLIDAAFLSSTDAMSARAMVGAPRQDPSLLSAGDLINLATRPASRDSVSARALEVALSSGQPIDPDAIAEIAASKDKGVFVRTVALEHLLKIEYADAASIARKIISNLDESPEMRAKAVDALGVADPKSAYKELYETTRDRNQSVATAAHRTLASLGDPDSSVWIRMELSESLSGSKLDFSKRAGVDASVKAAAKGATIDGMAGILETYETASTDGKQQILKSLTETWNSPHGAAGITAGLNALAESDEPMAPQARKLLDSITKATELDISPFKYSPETLAQIVSDRTRAPAEGEKTAVYVVAKSDATGALIYATMEIDAFRERGYRVLVFEADSVTSAARQITEAKDHGLFGGGALADLVAFAGHGSRNAMALGTSDPALGLRDKSVYAITPDNLSELAPFTDVLAAGGKISLLSCSVGANQTEDGKGNLGIGMREKVFKDAAPEGIQAPVVPLSVPTAHPSFDDHGRFERFNSQQRQQFTMTGDSESAFAA